MSETQIPEKLIKYGESKKGNFKVIDTIAVPHPYCLTPKHVKVASEQFNGMMNDDAIEEAEKQGIWCYTCREINRKHHTPILTRKQHELALLVACYADMKKVKFRKEAQTYLKGISKMVEEDGYAGFTFMKKFAD